MTDQEKETAEWLQAYISADQLTGTEAPLDFEEDEIVRVANQKVGQAIRCAMVDASRKRKAQLREKDTRIENLISHTTDLNNSLRTSRKDNEELKGQVDALHERNATLERECAKLREQVKGALSVLLEPKC